VRHPHYRSSRALCDGGSPGIDLGLWLRWLAPARDADDDFGWVSDDAA
jgi:hypothetical protein